MQTIIILPQGDGFVGPGGGELRNPMRNEVRRNLIEAQKSLKKLEESLPAGWMVKVEQVV